MIDRRPNAILPDDRWESRRTWRGLRNAAIVGLLGVLINWTCSPINAQPPTDDSPQAEASRPNILVILTDDMGYSDIGCYGGEIETPTLDQLAEQGLRYTQFYNAGRCCPTRASLLTGLYAHQAGVGHMTDRTRHPGYQGDLNEHCVTIAEVLRPAGYATFASGKWHVTRHRFPEDDQSNWPCQRGFDRFYGTLAGAGSFYDPQTLSRDNQAISPTTDPEYQPETYYYTDAISDQAVRFLDEHHQQQGEQPFFMYVAYTCAHYPMHALPEDIAEYEGRYEEGYRPIRQQRFERLQELGILDPAWQLSDQVGDWEEVRYKAWEARCMEVYAAMIDNMDRGIGRIVAELEANGQLDNTLILYMQDNGGSPENRMRGNASHAPQEATYVAAADPRPERVGGPENMPGPPNTFISYGRNWANVSNTPFREYKSFVHEGGIATPLIAHWPQGIARVGQLDTNPGHLIDVMATCVELAGAEYPERWEGSRIYPMEGISLVPTFTGQPLQREAALYWEHEGNRAVRQGDWKLVRRRQEWELYNLSADRTEMHDLADEEPERVEALSDLWHTWARRCHVLRER